MGKLFKFKTYNPSEGEIDFDSFIKFPDFCYDLVFLDFKTPSDDANLKEKIRHAVKINYLRFSLICLAAAATSSLAYSVLIAHDFVEVSACFLNAICVVLVLLKTSRNLFRKKDILKIFDELKEIFITRKTQNSRHRVKKYLDGYLRFIRAYAVGIFFDFVVSLPPTISFIIDGTMMTLVNYWFPFDATQNQNFPLVLYSANILLI